MPACIVTSGMPWAMRLAIRSMRKHEETTNASASERIYAPANAGHSDRTDGRTTGRRVPWRLVRPCHITNKNKNIMGKRFVNVTPHAITLNNGVVFPTSGTVARVSNTFGSPDKDNVMDISYGNIEGLPEPADNTLYIVSAIVLSAAKEKGRTDCVAPATGHPDCVRSDKGFIVSVPGFVR